MEFKEAKLPLMENTHNMKPVLNTLSPEETRQQQKTPSSLPQHILPTPEYLLSGVFDAQGDPLTKEQTNSALKHRVVSYPVRVKRINDDPPSDQSKGIITFMLFKEPRVTPSGNPVLGFFKLRGNYSNDSDCTARATQIVKEIDSKCVNRIAPVGKWLPICEDDLFVMDKLDVRENEEEIHLRDQAVKDADAERRRIQREIRDREEECKSGDIYDNKESLRYYSMRRVTDMRLTEAVETVSKSLARNISVQDECRAELKDLERRFPEYKNEWIETYNVERRKAGLPDFVPREDKFKDYENWTPITMPATENDDVKQ